MIQTFPKKWKLKGSKTDLEQVIGNAVPCNMAKFVGECILAYLKNRSTYDALHDANEQLTMFEQRARYSGSY